MLAPRQTGQDPASGGLLHKPMAELTSWQLRQWSNQMAPGIPARCCIDSLASDGSHCTGRWPLALLGADVKAHGVYLRLAAKDGCKQRASMQVLVSDGPAASLKRDLSAVNLWPSYGMYKMHRQASKQRMTRKASQNPLRRAAECDWVHAQERKTELHRMTGMVISCSTSHGPTRGKNWYLLHGVKSQGHLACTCVA